ncbi:MAG: F0F1 ATP synthase subunit epsilon [Gammaproteobacteria bacterium]|nr:MAG: F0F1 ATP synthase subunit epsilon [Gammaproteobacteria bacterium]
MANTITVEIVDADQHIYSGEGVIVSATASQGEIGVMHGHTPFLSSLKPGHVTIRKADDSEENIFISGGFIEVQPTHVTILADTAERAEDLDKAMAEEAMKEAKAALRSATGPDFQKAQHALAEASARLSLIQRLHK